MQFGLYHPPEKGAWRKVSEDSGGDRSFLLIDCTEGLSLPLARRVPSDTQCFQHIAKFINVTTTSSPNFPELYNIRLFSHLPIVTAAVYRGFDQELRLAADPIN